VPSAVASIRPTIRRASARKPARQRALAELGQRALEGAESEKLVAQAARLVAETLGVPYGAVLVWDGDAQRLRLAAGTGWKAARVGGVVIEGAAAAAALAAWREATPIVFGARADEPRMAGVALLDEHGVASGVSAPIVRATARSVSSRRTPTLTAGSRRRRSRSWKPWLGSSRSRSAASTASGRSSKRCSCRRCSSHVGRELMSCVDVAVLLERTCQLTTQALRCDHSVAWLRTHGEAGLRALAGAGVTPAQWEALDGVVIPPDAFSGLVADLAQREGLRLTIPAERHPLVSAVLARNGVVNAIVAALHEATTFSAS
jgi:hypothetical protein